MEIKNMKAMDYMTGDINVLVAPKVNVIEPNIDEIDIEDIARGLAYTCRFGGHLPVFYSVAQHSVFVSRLIVVSKKAGGIKGLS